MTELNFKGKEFVYNHHLSVPFRPLVPHADKGVGEVNLDGNLIIQGDNLHALKALLPRYAGEVDCIFIDPPYNTGNEGWAYNDNVNAPMIKEWLASNPIGIEDGLRHDKWCAMMWPRLRLLHELLAETGSIWITLDHNEGARARLMLDEIFGENNFLAHMAWEKVYSPRMDADGFSTDIDQVIVYAKNKPEVFLTSASAKQNEKQFTYVEPVTDRKARLRSLRKEGSASLRTDRENCWYGIEAPDGSLIWPIKPDGTEGRWRWEKATYDIEIAKSPSKAILIKDSNGKWDIFVKQYFKGIADRPISTLLRNTEFGHTHEAAEEIKSIFGSAAFSTPKPVRLIANILELACPTDGCVLDSFAGSATTAHAILSRNESDESERRFILVEMEDYADKLTAERIRRVINGYDFSGTQKTELIRENLNWRMLQKADDLVQKVNAIENLHGHEYDKITKQVKDGELIVTGEKSVAERAKGLGGSFTYCTLGEPVELDAILTGKNLPPYDALGSVLYHMATNRTLESAAIRQSEFHLGEHGDRHVWLIYKPDLEWLKGPEASLTLSFARKIATDFPAKDHLVFAASRFVSEKLLSEQGLRVEFVPLPFALYRIEQS